MLFTISKIMRKILSLIMKPYVRYKDMILPPKYLRWGGAKMKRDKYFLDTGKAEADRLIEHLNLSENSAVLDIGCGPGRVALGILSRLGSIRKFRGIDVHKESIRWCQKYIQNQYQNFQFICIDVENDRYNPDGKIRDNEVRLPFNDQEFDIIYLFSVFSHMTTDGVIQYIKEFERMLAMDGKIFLTGFFEENVPDMTVNPDGYYASNKLWGPLKDVRYNKDYFEKILSESGFQIDKFEYRQTVANRQSGVYISRKKS